MSDKKLRCALLYRLAAGGDATMLAKFDHAGQYESHGGATNESLYGGRDKSFADAVSAVINNDPPSALTESGTLGGFKVVQSDQHQVVYGADGDGVCLAVITGLAYPSRIAIQMLQELYSSVMSKFSSEVASAGENGLTKKAKNMLSDACAKYDDLSKVDKASSLLGKVDVVKTQMQSNISDMLKNTEKAESLAEKSDQLNEQASVFKKKSTDLRKQMAWKNLKMTLLLGGIVVVILIVILAPLIKRSKKN
mmetsp:Transcript_12790/g.25903  ORF Transcript_12790/g.25903 Transcript_12790/m.25903 type:complete len:251 (+) Transcript_12790:194-946(+)|eukprot:scaffold2413_cov171-Amphora_coffeaeformis.AAC.2